MPHCLQGTASESDFSVNTARGENACILWFPWLRPSVGKPTFTLLISSASISFCPAGLSTSYKKATESPVVTSLLQGHRLGTLGRTVGLTFRMDWLQLFFLHPLSFYQGAAFPFALLFNYLCILDTFSTRAR
jgi:hypothetical protein